MAISSFAVRQRTAGGHSSETSTCSRLTTAWDLSQDLGDLDGAREELRAALGSSNLVRGCGCQSGACSRSSEEISREIFFFVKLSAGAPAELEYSLRTFPRPGLSVQWNPERRSGNERARWQIYPDFPQKLTITLPHYWANESSISRCYRGVPKEPSSSIHKIRSTPSCRWHNQCWRLEHASALPRSMIIPEHPETHRGYYAWAEAYACSETTPRRWDPCAGRRNWSRKITKRITVSGLPSALWAIG